MRILFVTNPFKSHLYVQVPLAWALRTAGHEVCIAGPPDMADDIARTGVPGVSIGETLLLAEKVAAVPPIPEATGPADPRGLRTGKSVQSDFGWGDPYIEFKDLISGVKGVFYPDSTVNDMVDFAKTWQPDLVISDPTALPGVVAARAVGAAHCRMLFTVDRMAQLRAACRDRFATDGDPLRDWLEPLLAPYGAQFDESAVQGQWTLSPMPQWVWRPEGVHYVPMRNVPFNGPATTPKWVYEPPTRRRVCVTLGISHRDANIEGTSASAAELFDAVADLDIEVIATFNAKQLESVLKIPDNVRTVDFVPLNALLPSCAAIVHEGGCGTFATSIEHAVPQVIVPNDFKVEKWWGSIAMADAVESRGAGVYSVNAGSMTADVLRDSLKQVLEDPSYAENAAKARSEVRGMPTPYDVVPMLEKLTAEYRTSRP
ncbi:glycosyl transferase [Sphaerisporangium melleum]|uniref:Glycosyl transferase n=1 Tax=Sphaerisporangium melleum TaxID=321316 RepID=A0A917VGG0_9ACTN|nr:nucleotide disphospho-sugar-binding domain-containing protein [Sphaerisporangium melleum]GGK75042.1 glycosyl transferase [Sphaerisporangium melleum]GII70991.1 glycosyl transferase [Sphaerisporangium melleum]